MARKCDENLKDFNVMKDDFENSKFNTYCSGPGAHLDENFQKWTKQSKQDLKKRFPCLVIHCPKLLTMSGLRNKCERYGKIVDMRYNKHKQLYFMDLATVA